MNYGPRLNSCATLLTTISLSSTDTNSTMRRKFYTSTWSIAHMAICEVILKRMDHARKTSSGVYLFSSLAHCIFVTLGIMSALTSARLSIATSNLRTVRLASEEGSKSAHYCSLSWARSQCETGRFWSCLQTLARKVFDVYKWHCGVLVARIKD